MKKENLRSYILLAFVFVIYVVATIPFPKTVIFWIAFSFSLFAIISQLYTIRILKNGKARIKDRFYDYPQLRVSVLYLIIQIGVSILLMFLSEKIPVFAAVLVEVILLAVAVAGNFAVQAATGEVIRQETEIKRELAKMEELQEQIMRLIAQCDEGKKKEILQRLAEEVRYSNPVSNGISEEIEEEITVLFSEIEERILDDDLENAETLCDRMRGLLRERDRICKHRS